MLNQRLVSAFLQVAQSLASPYFDTVHTENPLTSFYLWNIFCAVKSRKRINNYWTRLSKISGFIAVMSRSVEFNSCFIIQPPSVISYLNPSLIAAGSDLPSTPLLWENCLISGDGNRKLYLFGRFSSKDNLLTASLRRESTSLCKMNIRY